MNSRSEVSAHIDRALDQLRPLDNETVLEQLRHRLNELLKPTDDLYDPPWVTFHSISVGPSGVLTAIVESLHIQEYIIQWCRSVEEYLGGRLSIEPNEEVDVRYLMAMREPGALSAATGRRPPRQEDDKA